jgi:hypothetical protein
LRRKLVTCALELEILLKLSACHSTTRGQVRKSLGFAIVVFVNYESDRKSTVVMTYNVQRKTKYICPKKVMKS